MKTVRSSSICLFVLTLLTPASATARAGSITDPVGDVVVLSGDGEGVDVSGVTINNGARAINIKVSFANVDAEGD